MAQLGSMFRSQLVFDKQRVLFDYWQSKCTDEALPRRSDISPLDFVPFLPMVSLIEVGGEPHARDYQVRLAGTGLYTVYHREITGMKLEEIHEAKSGDYWRRVLDVLVARKKPACGAMGANDHLAQFWMRLPLRDQTGAVNMILAYDVFTPLSALSPDNQLRVAQA
ncbi:MAG: PAS domain-containing protein [Robiginitomaculum sp.]|nr:PAS domain-containing protein [Robiginitomaculum sp.]